MLILDCSPGRRIVIGDSIVISVNRIVSGGRVVLNIDAPKEVHIRRAELPLHAYRDRGKEQDGAAGEPDKSTVENREPEENHAKD